MSEWRYEPIFRTMKMSESIWHFVKTFKWVTIEVRYKLLMEGDDGYEDAPFSSSVTFTGDVLKIKSKEL